VKSLPHDNHKNRFAVLRQFENENDPLSPPEGEADQGDHPLDPFFILPFFPEVFHEPSVVLSHHGGCPRGGGGGAKRWNPQERQRFSSISPEPEFFIAIIIVIENIIRINRTFIEKNLSKP